MCTDTQTSLKYCKQPDMNALFPLMKMELITLCISPFSTFFFLNRDRGLYILILALNTFTLLYCIQTFEL